MQMFGPARFQIDTPGRVGGPERVRREHLAGLAVDHIDVAIAIQVDQHLAQAAAERHIEQDLLVDSVVVVLVVRRKLVEPVSCAGLRIAGEDSGGPLVVPWALQLIPRPGIARAMVESVQLRIVGHPPPHVAAADFPGIRRPRAHTEVLALRTIVIGLEFRPDQYLLVRPGVVGLPGQLAAVLVQRRHPTAHSELAAGIAHITLPSATSGAMVIDSPMLMLPSWVRHTGLPVSTSRAMVWQDVILDMLFA